VTAAPTHATPLPQERPLGATPARLGARPIAGKARSYAQPAIAPIP
jgi:hypothetical protein